MASSPSSPWHIPLVREIAVILLIKLTILLSIRAVWFAEPTVPVEGTDKVSLHLLGTPATPSKPDEESPR